MSDGLNDVRALRLTEIMQDFRNLQHYIAQIRAAATAEEYYEQGYVLLRQCLAEGQAVLQAPFTAGKQNPEGNPEAEKRHLRVVMLDASSRRFKAQRIYLRATAAMRWINSRNSILAGQRPTQRHAAALQQVDVALQTELAAITDQRVMHDLHSTDVAQGKWVQEDPSLAVIRNWLEQQSMR